MLPEEFRGVPLTPLCNPVTYSSAFSHTVAGHLPDRHREGPDCCYRPGLTLPRRQHLLAHLVLTQPFSQVAAPGSALPDLLWHVRLHGCGLHR